MHKHGDPMYNGTSCEITANMKAQFTVHGVVSLRDGTVVLTGMVPGLDLDPGLLRISKTGFADTVSGYVKVQIIGVGFGDRDLKKPDMEMVQVRVLEGDGRLLNGATLYFE